MRYLKRFPNPYPFQLHNLELLKLRFGESRLHECEIMLQDLSEARRLNTNINKTLQSKEGATGRQSPSLPERYVIIIIMILNPTSTFSSFVSRL